MTHMTSIRSALAVIAFAALAADAAEKLMLQSMDSTYAAFIDAADKGETDGKQG